MGGRECDFDDENGDPDHHKLNDNNGDDHINNRHFHANHDSHEHEDDLNAHRHTNHDFHADDFHADEHHFNVHWDQDVVNSHDVDINPDSDDHYFVNDHSDHDGNYHDDRQFHYDYNHNFHDDNHAYHTIYIFTQRGRCIQRVRGSGRGFMFDLFHSAWPARTVAKRPLAQHARHVG